MAMGGIAAVLPSVATGSRAAMHARLIVGYKRQPLAQTKCGTPTVATGSGDI